MDNANPLLQISKIANQLPSSVIADIQRRSGDWLASGGKEDDPYIWQQLKYAQRVVQFLEK